MTTITELWRYPVKSMQGERIDEAELTEMGIAGDRAFAIVDRETGHVASAKHPRKWGQLLSFAARTLDDGAAEITVPGGAVIRSDDREVDRVLSDALGRAVTLARSAPHDRHFEAVYPDDIDGVLPAEFLAENKTGEEVEGTLADLALGLAAPPGTFFDLTVVHVITTATLARVGADVRRFRPNVVVAVDGEGFVENDWVGRALQVGGATVQVALPTMRCVMTTLPQPGLPQDRGVLQTVARDNRVEIPGLGTWACAGVYGSVTTAGPVRVSDAVAVLKS